MSRTTDPVALAECTVPLDDEGRWALYRHWERMVWEEWVPPLQRTAPARFREATPRERRVARRAVARIAAASGLAPVVPLRPATATAAGVAVAA